MDYELLNMFPGLVINYTANLVLSYTELFREFALGNLIGIIELADFQNLIGGYLAHAMTLALIIGWGINKTRHVSKYINRVAYVFRMGHILKISKAIVESITIPVIHFISLRTFTKKRLRNQSMNKFHAPHSLVYGYLYSTATVTSCGSLKNPTYKRSLSWSDSPNTTVITNFINTICTIYFFPLFHSPYYIGD